VYLLEVPKVSSARATHRSLFGDVALLLFLVAQASDGVLTFVGVRTFGLTVEGNPLVAWLMTVMGNGVGLATAKLAAVFFGIALHLSNVHRAVAALAGFYLVAAVLPWITLLFVWN
jgi:hypothetical protein